jgi:hypothetical protein
MGQKIELRSTTVLGEVALYDTDRSVTGQDGTAYPSAEAAAAGDDFPDRLAAEIFGADDAVSHVFIASNQVSVRRDGGFGGAAAERIGQVISEFFVFYAEGDEPVGIVEE